MILGGPLGSQGGPLGSQGGLPWGSQGALWADWPWAMGRWALWADWPFGPGPMGPGTRNEYNVNGFTNRKGALHHIGNIEKYKKIAIFRQNFPIFHYKSQ